MVALDERLDRTLAALAHPTRRAILHRLMEGEARVTDLAEPFDLSLNAVSRHIRTLEEADLVRRRRVWREHLVSYNPAPLDEAAQWIERQRAMWGRSLDALERVLLEEDEAAPNPSAPGAKSPPKARKERKP